MEGILTETIDEQFFNQTLIEFRNAGYDKLNLKILELFQIFNKYDDLNEIKIKVAALNKIYSTQILNITPVVINILESVDGKCENFSDHELAELIDKISKVKRTQKNGDVKYVKYISFSSKYIHFLSNFKMPIYDSYVYFMIRKYQKLNNKIIKCQPPENYVSFFKIFNEFKTDYGLEKYSNYEIDKFLWQQGNQLKKANAEKTKFVN